MSIRNPKTVPEFVNTVPCRCQRYVVEGLVQQVCLSSLSEIVLEWGDESGENEYNEVSWRVKIGESANGWQDNAHEMN